MLVEDNKNQSRGTRLQKSDRARAARKFIKNIREIKILGEWAKNRRIRKKTK